MNNAAMHGGAQALDVARRRDGNDVDPCDPGLADGPHHLETGDVGEIDVEQEQIGTRCRYHSQRLGTAAGLADDDEPGDLLDVGSMEVGHPEIVIHDQGADHARASAGAGLWPMGSRAVKTAPPWLTTVTWPPRRADTCLTSARPSPRRAPGAATLVVKPSEKMRSLFSPLMPGPESWTVMTTSPSSCRMETSTQRGRPCGEEATASSALSIRLPTTVIKSRGWPASPSRRLSGERRNWTPRSAATADLPSSSAPRTGSPTRSSSDSVSSCDTDDDSVVSCTASS